MVECLDLLGGLLGLVRRREEMIEVQLRDVPEGGLVLRGETEGDLFGLPADDVARASSPLRYDLVVRVVGDELIAEGEIEAEFRMSCGRCLEDMGYLVRLDPYFMEEEIAGKNIFDLTDRLREDILLALPAFPRCEQSNLDLRDCPAEGRFVVSEREESIESGTVGEGERVRERDIWATLDDLGME